MTRTTRSTREDGVAASSTTFGTSSGGRLSMTNQPRSSRLSAARLRPAPDRPVITTNSAIAPSVRPGSALLGPQDEQAGDGGRVAVLGRHGEEPGRGRRLQHPGDVEAPVGEGVDVATERPVEEGQAHARVDLLDRQVLLQVGAHPPVLL